jgi:hypothetical protein
MVEECGSEEPQRGLTIYIEKLYDLNKTGCSIEGRQAMRVKTSVKAGPEIKNGGIGLRSP